jgi:hypothetical protein
MSLSIQSEKPWKNREIRKSPVLRHSTTPITAGSEAFEKSISDPKNESFFSSTFLRSEIWTLALISSSIFWIRSFTFCWASSLRGISLNCTLRISPAPKTFAVTESLSISLLFPHLDAPPSILIGGNSRIRIKCLDIGVLLGQPKDKGIHIL